MYRLLRSLKRRRRVRPGGWLLFELGTNMRSSQSGRYWAIVGLKWKCRMTFAGFQRVLAALGLKS